MAKLIDLPTITVHYDQSVVSQGSGITATSLEDDLVQQGRACWRDLFLNVQTAEQLAIWETTIPAYCTCRSFYKEFKEKTPPAFNTGGGLQFEWKYSLKSAVNEKLNHSNLPLNEAIKYWANERVYQSSCRR